MTKNKKVKISKSNTSRVVELNKKIKIHKHNELEDLAFLQYKKTSVSPIKCFDEGWDDAGY